MLKSLSVLFATAMISGFSMAATAQPAHIATIPVTANPTGDVLFNDFKGAVNGLQITAEKGDLRCVTVTATFANGRTQKLFSGNLPANSSKDFKLFRSDVVELEVSCHVLDASAGAVGISSLD